MDTNEDRLDLDVLKSEAEMMGHGDHALKTQIFLAIEEVERLRKELASWEDDVEDIDNAQDVMRDEQIESMQNQIDSLTKERDEWKERYMKSTSKDFIEKVEKLEAENAELKQKLAEAEGNKCPACHGAGYHKSDPAFSQTITIFKCKVCEGKGRMG